jgi:Tfp pilus assembly protein PilO
MKAKTFFLVLCALLVILIVGGGAAYYWGHQQLTAQKEKVNKKQLDLSDSQKRTSQLIELSRKYEEANARIDDIDRALPRDSKQAEMLLEIRDAAAASGVRVASLQFTGAATPKNPNTNQALLQKDLYVLPISLRLGGSYPQLITFLEKLNKLGRLNSVTNLTTSKTITSPDQLDITMNLVAYLKP